MGEISFKYNNKHISVYESSFKYWFAESKEYSFAYQRYIALSDTSIFNDPVAISKVATGFYSLHDLFTDKITYSAIEKNISLTTKTNKKLNLKNHIIETYKELYKMSILAPTEIMQKIIKLNIYDKGYLTHKDNPIANAINIYNIIPKEKNGNVNKIYDFKIDKYGYLNDFNIIDKTVSYTNAFSHIFGNKSNRLKILGNDLLCSKDSSSINIWSTLLVSKILNYTNAIKTIMTEHDKYKYAEINTMQSLSKDFNTSSKNTDIVCDKIDYLNALVQNIYSGTLPGPTGYVLKHIGIKNKNYIKYINKDKILGCKTFDKIGNKYNIYSGKTYIKYFNMSNIYSGKPVSDYSSVPNDVLLSKIPIETKNTNDNSLYILSKREILSDELSANIFLNLREKKSFITFKNIFMDVRAKESYLQNTIWINKRDKSSLCNDINIFNTKNNKYIFETVNTVFISKTYKDVFTTLSSFINKNTKETFYVINNNIFTSKKGVDISKSIFDIFIHKTRKPIWLATKQIRLMKNRKGFRVENTTVFMYKKAYDMSINKQGISLYKNYKELNVKSDLKALYKKPVNLSKPNQKNVWLIKKAYNMRTVINQLFIEKQKKDLEIYQKGVFLLKQYVTAGTTDIDSLIKSYIPADLLNEISREYAGMIIPISKVKYKAYTDKIDEMVYRKSKDVYISKSIFSSVFSKDIGYEDGVFFDKEQHNLYIEYKNTMITKSKVYSFANTKNQYSDNNIFATKNQRKIYSEQLLSASRKEYNAWIENIPIANKMFHTGILNKEEWSSDKEYYLSVPDSLFIDKTDKICYYDYGIFADKSNYRLMLQKDNFILKDNKKMHLADLVSEAIKDNNKIFYNYEVFSSETIKESALFKEIDSVERTLQELMIRPDDFGNWAWVYETPDPIDVVYGIDELLLPENDTRYSDFENIIFNKETMKPRNPVKVINDTTFIAKYPHKHPIPEYSDVAVNYDDSAVKYEQYFGIKTEIMHKVFLKYYRIWQSKIFEFGTMTMVQAVKKMLEYLYSWIMIYFSPEEIEQALRVFKLIRWYGESAIVQNSQYIVSYEYDTLESKLTSGTCAIPNDLGTNNDTMFVDASLGVIRNNPLYANGSGSAYVNLYIDNRKNTSITFSLSNTVGSVNIYLNNNLVDVISSSVLNITYQIPYTGDVNIIKIEKTASNNLNEHFYIGNIKVPELSFKDLSIEFDPTLKMGNKPLNEVANKMIQYANMHDDFKEAYSNIRKSNLGVQETYKKMIEYWKIHHQDKIKGKRLTIKQV